MREFLSSGRALGVELSVVFDSRFFAVLPALNINGHSRTLEFEWLFFGVYLDLRT